MGVAGSGKTALAREIARRLRLVYLDNNHVADAFFPYTRSGRAYERFRPRFYRVLYAITEANLKLGNSVLLDVPHIKDVQKAEWRAFIQRLARRTQAKLIVIRCFCSESTLRNRILSRGEPRDRWKLVHWQEFLVREPADVRIPFRHLELNTEGSLPRNVAAAVSYVRTRLEPRTTVVFA